MIELNSIWNTTEPDEYCQLFRCVRSTLLSVYGRRRQSSGGDGLGDGRRRVSALCF